ncbi:unnamed protein product [Clonostachys rhizophaga]|uniref:Uncharacterized protein n=1 Tax=Clonostachys rhizophaga TaxID=160324 RepID=A0A9N9VZP7_9HYPO|nr:unnamed protein product [Clonostachys rhizophaga]
MASLPLRGTEASIYIIPEPDFSIDLDAPDAQWPDVEPPPEFFQVPVRKEQEGLKEEEEEEEEEEVNLDDIWAAAAVDFEQAERLARLSLRGDLYSHLPHSTVNWSIGGKHICRVEECPKYGVSFRILDGLKKHLNTQMHKELDRTLASRFITPPPEPQPEVPPPRPTKRPVSPSEFWEPRVRARLGTWLATEGILPDSEDGMDSEDDGNSVGGQVVEVAGS